MINYNLLKSIFPLSKRYYNIYLKFLSLIFLVYLKHNIFEIPRLENAIDLTLTTLIYYFIISLLFGYLRSVLIKFYLLKHKYPKDHKDNFIIGIKRLGFFFNHFVFLIVFLNILGIQFFEVLATLSLVAVELVLIFKEYIANFLNGINIMFSKNIKLGEYVKIGDYKGRINDVSFVNVQLHTNSGEVIYIPNSTVLSKELTNFSKKQTKSFKCEFTVNKIKTSEIKTLNKKVLDSLQKEIKKDIKAQFNIERINKDSVELSFEFKVDNYKFEIEEKIKYFVNKKIIEFLETQKKK